MILVVGSTGALGGRVARKLLEAGERVRAASRDPRRGERWAALGAETVPLDLLRPDGFAAALAGVDAVVVAAHGLVPPSRRNTPTAVDGDGARRLIDAAAAAGVGRIVYLSATGAAGEATLFARVTRATERHLERSGVAWTVLRPSIFIENHAIVLLGEPLRSGRPVPFFGAGTEPLNWISAEDVADATVAALRDPTAEGKVLELRGTDRMSRREALAEIERAVGRVARRQHLPVGVVRLARAATRALHPGVHALLDLALHEIVRGGDPVDEVERADVVGPTPLAQVVAAWARGGRSAGA